MNIENPTGRLARWSLLIQQFDFEILHRPGKENGNADSLSRRPYKICQLTTSDNETRNEILEFQRRDVDLASIIEYLEDGILPHEETKTRKILLSSDSFLVGEDKLLYHLERNRRRKCRAKHELTLQLVIPASMKYEVVANAHDHMVGGHFGVYKTFDKIFQKYWWEGMYKDVEHWCKSCIDCSMRKRAPLLSIPVEGPFDRLAVDCLGPFPVSHKGNRYIVVFSDYLTRWPEAFAVPYIEVSEIA